MANLRENTDHVQSALLERSGAEQLGLSRAMPYGAAATSFAILCTMTQVETNELDAKIAILGASLSLPLWLVLATIYEYYLYLGQNSYAHYRSPSVQKIIKHLSYVAGPLLFLSVGALVHILYPPALIGYLVSCGVATWLLLRFNSILGIWLQDNETRE